MPLRVNNVTRGRTLALRAVRAGGFWPRFFGLMGRPGLPAGEALHLVPCNGIHSFFMRFAIDAVFLNRELRVVRCVEAMPPWRATPVFRAAHSVLELPAGTLAATGTVPGDVLSFDGG
ncbi:MAG: DUF192 domain-containing protein [Deltaproteobacteria bacterium]|nr:DUF192 domain-containing protein [Deltaproteobacteria bacterium]